MGTTPAAVECKILNENAIKLIYKPSQEILIAYADEPLIIKNRFLGYIVNYNLQNFKVQYETSLNGFQSVFSTYYSGFTCFEELKKKTSKKHIRKRDLSYKGSLIHFLRSVYKKQLSENKFKIYKVAKEKTPNSETKVSYEIPPFSKIKISMDKNLAKIELLSKELIIMFSNSLQSTLIGEEIFYIDNYGNH